MIIGSIAVIAGCIAGTVLLKKSNKLLESGDHQRIIGCTKASESQRLFL